MYSRLFSHPNFFFKGGTCLLGGNGHHTHINCAWLIAKHEQHKSVQHVILTKVALDHKAVTRNVMIDGSRFLMRLQVSHWNAIETFCLISGMCVCLAGKIPSNKTPPPVFLPPCQPNRDKNAQHSHTQTYRN